MLGRQVLGWTAMTLVAGGILLGAGASARADGKDAEWGCSAATLRGTYAVSSSGYVPGGPPPAPLAPFASAAHVTFDGRGNLSENITFSDNGNVVRETQHGTYTVARDCTARMTVFIGGPPFELSFDLVIADVDGAARGKQFYLVSATPGGVLSGTGTRIR